MLLFKTIFLVVGISLAGLTLAEKADRNKPMNVEADALRHEDLKQTSVFSGKVVLTKGSLIIRGDTLTLREDAQGYQHGLVTALPGTLAFFRQKREGLDEFMEGEGVTIEYDGKADTVKFIKQAQLRRYRGASLNDEMTGNLIVYNSSSEVFTIDGGQTQTQSQSNSQSRTASSSGRVRVMLSPKTPVDDAGTSAKPTVAPPALRSSTTLGEKTK